MKRVSSRGLMSPRSCGPCGVTRGSIEIGCSRLCALPCVTAFAATPIGHGPQARGYIDAICGIALRRLTDTRFHTALLEALRRSATTFLPIAQRRDPRQFFAFQQFQRRTAPS
jgi:hypothetical protein